MKKLLVLLTALILSIMATGCSGSGDTPRGAAESAINAVKSGNAASIESYFGTANVLGDDVTVDMAKALTANATVKTGALKNLDGVFNVTVDITNVDMTQALASVDLAGADDAQKVQLIADAVAANKSVTVTKTALLPVEKDANGAWKVHEIPADFVTALSGGYK